jgi:hypothetical protein
MLSARLRVALAGRGKKVLRNGVGRGKRACGMAALGASLQPLAPAPRTRQPTANPPGSSRRARPPTAAAGTGHERLARPQDDSG